VIIFGERHQHTSRNYVPIQLSLFIYFYLLYLPLNNSDGNDVKRIKRAFLGRRLVAVKQPVVQTPLVLKRAGLVYQSSK